MMALTAFWIETSLLFERLLSCFECWSPCFKNVFTNVLKFGFKGNQEKDSNTIQRVAKFNILFSNISSLRI